MTTLFFAHSGLRYLVLLAGFAALVYYAYAIGTRRPVDRPAVVVGALFTGLLDLQILLGLALVALGIYYPALIGHLTLMLLAAATAHGTGMFARRAGSPRRYYTVRLFGVLLAFVLMLAGILAIGREIFGTGRPTLVG